MKKENFDMEDSDPPIGEVSFGDFRQEGPIGLEFGSERGTPIDRYYIEKFIKGCIKDVKGTVLEFEDDTYTYKYGGTAVSNSEVMNLDPDNLKATIIGDITKADFIPSNKFNCIICTQMLFLIYDFKLAVSMLHRILKPKGTLLITVPGIAQTAYDEDGSWHDHWRFTKVSLRKLLCEFFPETKIDICSYGNVLSAVSFLQGLALEELTEEELEYNDQDYEVIISARAVKGEVTPNH